MRAGSFLELFHYLRLRTESTVHRPARILTCFIASDPKRIRCVTSDAAFTVGEPSSYVSHFVFDPQQRGSRILGVQDLVDGGAFHSQEVV